MSKEIYSKIIDHHLYKTGNGPFKPWDKHELSMKINNNYNAFPCPCHISSQIRINLALDSCFLQAFLQ